MDKETVLTEKQRDLVAANLDIVEWAIYDHIIANEHIHGFARDDLFQEGCLWLCHAARTHDDGQSKFRTFAQVVVKNGLVDYCRRMCRIQKRQSYLSDTLAEPEDGTDGSLLERLAAPDELDAHLSRELMLSELAAAKTTLSGVALLGVEALELKIAGYTGPEIARMYGVKPNHVGAWISRAAQKLRQNEDFMAALF